MLERGKLDRGVVEIVDTESLVPKEHLLRKIDAAVDFNRLYEMVEPLYCEENGRPSIDPVVLFKMVLIQHLYGLPSLRRTAEEVGLNVAYRFVSSGHIQELYFINGSTQAANVRAANKALKKLRDYGLLKPLERRIGGVRAGSTALTWHLTEPGERLLDLDGPKDHPRKRFEEPSRNFLAHTLSVVEYAVELVTFCRKQTDMSVVTLAPEPECWRPYSISGKTLFLKPDLYAVLSSGEFEYQFYFEIDLGTEPMPKLMKKCQTYLDYYYSGEDQKKSGLFPLVVWVVPDEGRKQKLTEKIEENFSNKAQIFKTKLAEDNPQELLL